MRPQHVLTGIVFTLLTLSGCGASRKQAAPEGPSRVPASVLVEQELSGRHLGKMLDAPAGVAVGRRAELYVVDAGNNRLIEFDSTLRAVRETGGYGRSQGSLDQPTYVTVDNDLNLWVVDKGNRRLCRFDRGLHYVDEIKLFDENDLLKYGQPAGLAVTSFGEVWLADFDNNRIVIFDNAGTFDKLIDGYGYSGGELREPAELISDDDRNFLVADAGHQRVAVFDEYGNFLRSQVENFYAYPQALALDNDHNLWILDGDANTINCVLGDEELLTVGPVIPGTAVPLRDPADVVVDPRGRLIISDSGNDRVLICRISYEQP